MFFVSTALLLLVGSQGAEVNTSDLAWVDSPGAWHQQLARIVDHRFTTFAELKVFLTAAKQVGPVLSTSCRFNKRKTALALGTMDCSSAATLTAATL